MAFTSDTTWAARSAKAVLLIRILVGWGFLFEGIQKFLFPDSLGIGRFAKIGIPCLRGVPSWACYMANRFRL
jgi:uncharacterized membrane protein YphA (DoxX/SURF4 family)